MAPGYLGKTVDSWPDTCHFPRQHYCYPFGIRGHASPSPPSFFSAVCRAECLIDICIKCHKSWKLKAARKLRGQPVL